MSALLAKTTCESSSNSTCQNFFSISDENIQSSPWTRADLNVHLMKYVSVGSGGIFASQAKDESIWCRFFMENNKPSTKTKMTEKGDGWSKIANVS